MLTMIMAVEVGSYLYTIPISQAEHFQLLHAKEVTSAFGQGLNRGPRDLLEIVPFCQSEEMDFLQRGMILKLA